MLEEKISKKKPSEITADEVERLLNLADLVEKKKYEIELGMDRSRLKMLILIVAVFVSLSLGFGSGFIDGMKIKLSSIGYFAFSGFGLLVLFSEFRSYVKMKSNLDAEVRIMRDLIPIIHNLWEGVFSSLPIVTRSIFEMRLKRLSYNSDQKSLLALMEKCSVSAANKKI